MTRPTPASVPPHRPEPTFDYVARLLPLDAFAFAPEEPPLPSSWTVTHGFGKPAAGTYTEVRFTDEALGRVEGETGDTVPEHVLDAVVRRVAADLYGTAWAFHYRPDSYADAIARHGVRRREVVVVTSIEVYA